MTCTGRRFAFCGTVPGVAPAGRYPAPCFRGARTFLPPDLAARGATIRPSGGGRVVRDGRAVNNSMKLDQKGTKPEASLMAQLIERLDHRGTRRDAGSAGSPMKKQRRAGIAVHARRALGYDRA